VPNVQDIRRRIRSVRSTQQITKAMKMVAAAKLRRAQDRVFGARPYSDRLRDFLGSVLARPEASSHPLAEERPVRRLELVVVSADRGLAGGFNANVMREASILAGQARAAGQEVRLTLVGRKAWDFFKRRDLPVRQKHTDLFRALGYADAYPIADDLIRLFLEEEADRVVLVGNTFKSILSQIVRVTQLLPLTPGAPPEGGEAYDPLFAPGEEEILRQLVPRVVRVIIARALLESLAAEHAARMTAMDGATKNAEEMIHQLTLTMNRVRQASITRELIEIVSGAQAL
jgi:F-type H+-transporting ATPase subunit gamma